MESTITITPFPARPRQAPTEATAAVAGGTLAYTIAGAGEPLLLVHGLGGSRRTWQHLIHDLSATHLVVAPDLPGHGDSDAPAGDYSLGAHAAAVRDLLVALELPSATVVGHSLGGGVAMQFAYQFPERVDRLVLVSSGGLGPEVTPMLRAATLPGAEAVVAGLARIPEGLTRRLLVPLAGLSGLLAGQDAAPLADGLRGLAQERRRRAFVRTARSVLDWRGQSISGSRQLGMLADLPVLVAWGTHDRTIPPRHHEAVIHDLPHAVLAEIPGAGHYPHETAPELLLPVVQTFLSTTRPVHYEESRWRELLRTPRVAA